MVVIRLKETLKPFKVFRVETLSDQPFVFNAIVDMLFDPLGFGIRLESCTVPSKEIRLEANLFTSVIPDACCLPGTSFSQYRAAK